MTRLSRTCASWLAAFVLASAPAEAKSRQTKAEANTSPCSEFGLGVLISPLQPTKGAPMRILIASEKPLDGELSVYDPAGALAVKTSERRGGGLPYYWLAEVAAAGEGQWQAKLVRSGAEGECASITRSIHVRKTSGGIPGDAQNSVWPIRGSWNRAAENLYSAWIEKLFDAPLEDQLSWPALHDVLRDKTRNFLFGHLGLREDEKGMTIRPDCADLPYFLRTYFAFKMGLPFGYSKCSRGSGGAPPRCSQWWNIKKQETQQSSAAEASSGGLIAMFDDPGNKPQTKVPKPPSGLLPGFGFYMSTTVANGVHSGNGRTAPDDDKTDYYPVSLSAETLRPGTIYADPYGHVLVISKRIAQTKEAAGVILAVDGQPDGTVARKRFWRGNFLFAQDKALGGPGFKRFRPIVSKIGGLRRLSNSEIAASEDYADFSLDPSKMDVEAFYDHMDDVMSPQPLDPLRAMTEAITALEEQVKTRVTSVENGRKYQTGGGGEAAMPDGAAIFETTGAWEDFATPSRDLRLLIAIDVVRGFPDRVARRPERFAMSKDKPLSDVKAELEGVLNNELSTRKFSYTRTDGSSQTLVLKDVVARMAALEIAYNLNDCVEIRWGAVEGSDEASTCKRRAPASQRQKMAEYRTWFHERRRPPRP